MIEIRLDYTVFVFAMRVITNLYLKKRNNAFV